MTDREDMNIGDRIGIIALSRENKDLKTDRDNLRSEVFQQAMEIERLTKELSAAQELLADCTGVKGQKTVDAIFGVSFAEALHRVHYYERLARVYAICNNAIYFNDRSDYLSALYSACRVIQPNESATGVNYIDSYTIDGVKTQVKVGGSREE